MDSAPSDEAATDQLIDACLRGDQAAWNAIVQRYRRRVFNVAYTFVGKHDEAEDLTQDIFLVLPGLAWVEVEPSAVKIDRRREV